MPNIIKSIQDIWYKPIAAVSVRKKPDMQLGTDKPEAALDLFERVRFDFPGRPPESIAEISLPVFGPADIKRGISMVGERPLSIQKILEAQSIFKSLAGDPNLGETATLWLAISRRLQAKDVGSELYAIAKSNPHNRLAIVNYAANEVSKFPPSMVFPRIKNLPDSGSLLINHIDGHRDDCYARLLLVLLKANTIENHREAISLAESLYLDFPNYSAGISVLAVLLHQAYFVASALDFAEEALAKDSFNFQARGLIEIIRNGYDNVSLKSTTHTRNKFSWTSEESILCGAYFLQDPLCNEKKIATY